MAWKTCTACAGDGFIREERETGSMTEACCECDGEGAIEAPDDPYMFDED